MNETSARAGVLKVSMRVHYSSYHLWAAHHFGHLATVRENESPVRPAFDIQHRAYVTNAVLSAVCFLEAAINEIFQDTADSYGSYLQEVDTGVRALMASMWSLTEEKGRSAFSLLERYQLALVVARREPFDPGQGPFQDAALLVRLRNALVHFKPETLGADDPHRLSMQLRGKFQENPLMHGSGNPFFPDKCLGSGCALWAVASARCFADGFFERLGVRPHYQRITFAPADG